MERLNIDTIYLNKFLSKIDKNGPVSSYRPDLGPCWTWRGLTNHDGYGRLHIKSRYVFSHRISYEVYVGKIKKGFEVDHLCRNRLCCNPEHLEQVSHAENIRRGVSPAGMNARKTHCRNGHSFEKNFFIDHKGSRQCCICYRQYHKKYRRDNSEKMSDYLKEYRKTHPVDLEKARLYMRNYRASKKNANSNT